MGGVAAAHPEPPCRGGWGPMWRMMTTASVGGVGFKFATFFVLFSLKVDI